jgi:hypothetical protein
MKENVTYQIGNTVQAYDGSIGIVIYTHQRTGTAFPDEQWVWIKCLSGSIMDAPAAYFRTVESNCLEAVN